MSTKLAPPAPPSCLMRLDSSKSDQKGGTLIGAARHDVPHDSDEFSTDPASGDGTVGAATAGAYQSGRGRPLAVRRERILADRRRLELPRRAKVGSRFGEVESLESYAQTAHLASRFALSRASLAFAPAAASCSGTSAPFPKYISSGV